MPKDKQHRLTPTTAGCWGKASFNVSVLNLPHSDISAQTHLRRHRGPQLTIFTQPFQLCNNWLTTSWMHLKHWIHRGYQAVYEIDKRVRGREWTKSLRRKRSKRTRTTSTCCDILGATLVMGNNGIITAFSFKPINYIRSYADITIISTLGAFQYACLLCSCVTTTRNCVIS